MDLLEILQPEPLRAEAGRERRGARVGKHPPDLLLEHGRRPQGLLLRRAHQLGVRRRGPEEIGQPRREIEIGEPVILAGLCGRPDFLEPENEMRAREDGLQRGPDAGLEIPILPACLVELHQPGEVVRRERTAVRAPRELRHDLRRARRLFLRLERPAREHLAAAGRLRDPGHLVRSDNRQVAEVRQRRDAERAADLRVGQRVLDRRAGCHPPVLRNAE